MSSVDWKRVQALYHEALERPEAERRIFLDEACGDDHSLRAEVDELLSARDQREGFLGESGKDVTRNVVGRLEDVVGNAAGLSPAEPLGLSSGERIGPYKLLQSIGEGGFGSVWMAEQEHPVRRNVALKVIKLGMDTKEVIARFEAERQALAMMDHPNIAKVLDAGANEQGRPYFVMELVKGIPITEYCDVNNLRTRERLELFISVCHALQHAHQKGVIHRDLKPTNILVTLHDGRAVPKVIDFGIAKATNARLTEMTFFTRFHQMIGTPAYMSPEQAEMSGLDVDTRSDIYSLGVLLYELLTGTTPFTSEELLKHGYAEIQRIIREDEPQRPSVRLSSMGDKGLTAVAKNRQLEPRALEKLLSGDLDWIVMKSLEKDRTRRYESATAFAQDIERHLSSEPVSAAAPSTSYRLRKFVARNRIPVMAASAVVAALTAGLVASVFFALDAKKSADTAMANLALARKNEAEANLRAIEYLRRDAEDLWPSSSLKVADMEAWLVKARELADNLPRYRATLRELEGEALPWDEKTRAKDRNLHAKVEALAELEFRAKELEQERAKLERAGHASSEVTLLSFGEDEKRKPITYYFRHIFDVEKPESVKVLRLLLFATNGAAVYLNGEEIHRKNLPAGSLSFITPASRGSRFLRDETEVPAKLQRGENILAVEVHRRLPSPGSSDELRFSLGLTGIVDEDKARTLVVEKARWRYADGGEDLGTAWREHGYNASAWKAGKAPFGYGYRWKKGEDLLVGEEQKNNPVTYYFRKIFTDDGGAADTLRLSLLADGAATVYVYLNGEEIHRKNPPEGGPLRLLREETEVPAKIRFEKKNLLAVKVHQVSPRSSKLRFSLAVTRIESDGKERREIGENVYWDYYCADSSEDIGTAWRRKYRYDKSDWKQGTAPFGWGDEELAGRSAELRLEIQKLRNEIAALEEEISSTRVSWTFAESRERSAIDKEWWHATLSDLVSELELFSDPDPLKGTLASVERRLAYASSVRERTVEGEAAKRKWQEAAAAIANVEAYNGFKLTPQEGLLPIGPDPATGLWEFAHLETGEVPQRGDNGKLVLTKETGLVFVLIPGGSFRMGAEDQHLRFTDPVHQVTLSPFFLSKYKMTQGQWTRSTGGNPSFFGNEHTLFLPVDQVSWEDCERVLGRLGLLLPTEAQWEYAARAGAVTWWGDRPTDYFGKKGSLVPVGTYASSPFGLHDVLGRNEWCRDRFGFYHLDWKAGDGERVVPGLPLDENAFSPSAPFERGAGTYQFGADRVFRGGSHFRGTGLVARHTAAPSYLHRDLGVRPARVVSGQPQGD